MNILKLNNVSYLPDNKRILDSISLSVEDTDFISIIGPSGSGKSTLLKICCHLISPSSGDIIYRDKNIFEYDPIKLRRKISYCFQTPYMFENTVKDNLLFPYSIRNSVPDLYKINNLLSLFNLDKDILSKEVSKLSGGEKQRISLIRTLLFKPDILLLDEVTSALDRDNTMIVENAIKKINSQGTTVLWITHNMEQSKKFANKILTIENGKIKSLEVL